MLQGYLGVKVFHCQCMWLEVNLVHLGLNIHIWAEQEIQRLEIILIQASNYLHSMQAYWLVEGDPL